ncbi:pantoate--beta-alanine ligase [Mongoliitalea daihaiensis]|uniref:pantoate--beta-alanine ligase n=1 Tax=Mongoliitalea daihaiensis TaxID=2782006 RepID=UPI001F2314BB|nr:pantoate--beta-alanine ligase [Mongoliitalea daihaiensis]UJP66260.1 pantoate--beta-alanine ligase [Mongoliitalea daihaiensis]
MKVAPTIEELRTNLKSHHADNQLIGFVPTMGALHEGHLALVDKAKESSDTTVVSIFINPLQFNNAQDFSTYPQTLESDLELLEKRGVDVVFLPSKEELYPMQPSLSINFGPLERTLEGEFRPGHFSGVGIIVSKLLNIVKPHVAYFGQKDLQQVAVIQTLVRDLSIDVKIQVVPTVRESDGLAMSSRNLRLTTQERKAARLLYQVLNFCKIELLAGRDWLTTRQEALQMIRHESLASMEYLELVSTYSLQKQEKFEPEQALSLVIACFIGEVRLIDNLPVNL